MSGGTWIWIVSKRGCSKQSPLWPGSSSWVGQRSHLGVVSPPHSTPRDLAEWSARALHQQGGSSLGHPLAALETQLKKALPGPTCHPTS